MLRIRSALLLLAGLFLVGFFFSASAAFAAGIPIRGRVLDAAGAPLAKARVRLVPLASAYAAGRPKAEGKDEPAAAASAESGADGGFLLEAPGPGMWKVVVGGSSGGKLAPQEALAAPLTDELDLPAVRLRQEIGRRVPGVVWGQPAVVPPPGKPPAGEVAVRVVATADGRPLPGALVWWTADPGGFRRTDARGDARLAVPAGEPFTLQAAAPGFLLDELEVRKVEETPQEKTRKPLTLSLEPDLALTGVVVDEAGAPVAGAEIAPSNRPGLPAVTMMRVFRNRGSLARSGPGGRFRLGGLVAGVDYELRVTKDGFAPSRVQAAVAPDGAPGRPAAPLRLVLERGRSAFGKVLDPDRRPVAGAQVTLRASVPAGTERFRSVLFPERLDTFEAVTAADGRFDLDHLPAGRYDLTARGRGWAPLTVPTLEIPEAHRATDLGTLVLAPGVALEGSVVDSAGKPVEGAAIHLREPIDNSFPFPLPGPEEEPAALSGPDGFFRIEDLRAGSTVSLSVLRTGYMAGEAKGVRLPADQPVRIALQEVGTLSGRVMDSDGKPIEGVSVQVGFQQRHLFVRRGGAPMESRSDPEGLFRIQDVPPGPVDLIARASGWQPGTVDGLELRAGEDKRGIEIVLSPAAVLRGRVLAPSGRAVPEAQVMLAPEDRQRGVHSATTDDEGRYELDGLPPGLRTLEATHPDHGMARRQVEVRVGDNAFDISLEAGTEVSGRAVNEDGTPVAGAQVWLSAFGGRPARTSTMSQSDGGFRFAAVADGSYRAGVEKEGFARSEGVPVTVAGSSVEGLELRLTRGGSLIGRITGVDAAELSRVQMMALGRGAPLGGRVEPDGSYRIDHLQQGEWRVRAELPGTALYAEGVVRLEPGASEARLDLEMERGYELAGRVRQSGAPVVGETLGLEGPGRRRAVRETDADGRFRFSGLAAGSFRLRVGDRLRHEETVDLQGDLDITIDLAAGEVKGRVVDAADASPLANVTVQLVAADSDSILSQDRTDSRGVFVLRNVAEGSLRVRAQADGYAPAEAAVRVDSSGPSGEVELSLRATEGVTLQVAVAAGALPRSLFYVVLDGAGRKAGDGTAAVGEAGKVRLSRVPAGVWQVLLLSDSTAATEITVTAPGDAGQVTLPPPCTLRVSVPALREVQMPATLTLTGAGGRPFRTFARIFEPAATWNLRRGTAVLSDMPPGTWDVRVTAEDGRTWRTTATTAPGAPAEAVLD